MAATETLYLWTERENGLYELLVPEKRIALAVETSGPRALSAMMSRRRMQAKKGKAYETMFCKGVPCSLVPQRIDMALLIQRTDGNQALPAFEILYQMGRIGYAVDYTAQGKDVKHSEKPRQKIIEAADASVRGVVWARYVNESSLPRNCIDAIVGNAVLTD